MAEKGSKNRPQKEWRSYIAYAWNLKFNKVENGEKERIKILQHKFHYTFCEYMENGKLMLKYCCKKDW